MTGQLINLQDYTITQLVSFFICLLCWLYAYVFVVKDTIKYKFVQIPLFAIFLNFGWEITTTFWAHPNMGDIVYIGYFGWAVVDTVIVILSFIYGKSQLNHKILKDNFYPIMVLGLIGGFISTFFFIRQYDLPGAPLTGFILNIEMSILFVMMALTHDIRLLSKHVAWGKFLGTAGASLTFFLKYPENNFLITLYISIFIIDVFYIFLLYNPKVVKGRS
ncbi:MAG: hypothetical protein GY775_03160 [Candidatus Scalindua sp.]|nr:hypothetical protein [Candidatus Scalindua sp.]